MAAPVAFRKTDDAVKQELTRRDRSEAERRELEQARLKRLEKVDYPYFGRYVHDLYDEYEIPRERINAYYKGVSSGILRRSIITGKVEGGSQHTAIFVTPDIGLAEAYTVWAGATRAEGVAQMVFQTSQAEYIIVFRKEALERHFAVVHGEQAVLSNDYMVLLTPDTVELDRRKETILQTVIPFTSEFVSEVIAYDEAGLVVAKELLAGKGIPATLMTRERAQEMERTDPALRLSEDLPESQQLYHARELVRAKKLEEAKAEYGLILEKNPKCERALIDLFYITHDYSLLDKAIEANPNSYLAWLTKSLAWPHKISAIWRMKGVDIKRELFKDYQTELYSGI